MLFALILLASSGAPATETFCDAAGNIHFKVNSVEVSQDDFVAQFPLQFVGTDAQGKPYDFRLACVKQAGALGNVGVTWSILRVKP